MAVVPSLRAGAADQPAYGGQTYYGRPALKPAPFDWRVGTYVWLAGLAGSAQLIAAIADRVAPERLRTTVRNGRLLALFGAVAGPPLLIGDLRTPSRWYNMLRIYRGTSPMSLGSWMLAGFGVFSGLTAAGQILGNRLGTARARRRVRRGTAAAQAPAAALGAGMSIYTASLFSATSTPAWSARPRLLSARFGSSAMATAAAALSLGEHLTGDREAAYRLDNVTLAATAAEAAASAAATQRVERGTPGRVQRSRPAAQEIGAVGLGIGLPLLCLGVNAVARRRSPALSIVGSLAALAGGMMLRQEVLRGGRESAARPADYFRLAQPRSLPRHGRAAAVRKAGPLAPRGSG